MQETVGQILKKNRLEKNYSIKDVADATKITGRHITAIEENNFDIFPGETYVLGFIRSYSNFLGIDPDQMIQIYRGNQMEELEPPLEELTGPTVTIYDYLKKYLYWPLIILAGIFVIGGIILVIKSNSNQPVHTEESAGSEKDLARILTESLKIPDIETEHIKLASGNATALISVKNGIDFSIQNNEVYLVLDRLDYKTVQGNLSRAYLFLYPGKKVIQLAENELTNIEEQGIKPFKIRFMGATPNMIKIQIQYAGTDYEEQESVTTIANPSNFIILLDALTTGENFVEFYVDGSLRKRGLLPASSELHYEANDSIQMKIGDAGAIDIKINGKPQVFGVRGQQINKIIRKIKDPVEQTKFQISIKDS
ncbi:MAG: helix-turn-helix domain-containing protein [Spirochaetia bacterium]|nr:helix-turn-helix domain-containing protein [Spirochaetia bacterium]